MELNDERHREIVIARLIANTIRKKRPDNLIQVAKDILWLSNYEGNLKKVSKLIGISTEMLRKFLSVKFLSPEVKRLVEHRKIDSVTIVHLMKNFDEYSQKIIAKEVMDGRLTVDDMKVLVPLKKNLKDLKINQLISRLYESKDQKIYVIYFEVPSILAHFNTLENRFKKIIRESEIASFYVKDKVGTLELTSAGLKELRKASKENNVSLRKFVDTIVNQ